MQGLEVRIIIELWTMSICLFSAVYGIVRMFVLTKEKGVSDYYVDAVRRLYGKSAVWYTVGFLLHLVGLRYCIKWVYVQPPSWDYVPVSVDRATASFYQYLWQEGAGVLFLSLLASLCTLLLVCSLFTMIRARREYWRRE